MVSSTFSFPLLLLPLVGFELIDILRCEVEIGDWKGLWGGFGFLDESFGEVRFVARGLTFQILVFE